MSFTATVLTLYPEMFPGPLGHSLAGKALASGVWSLEVRDIREQASTGTPASTTRRPAGAPAWSCAPTCWLPPSTPPHRRAMPAARLLMSPRGCPLTQDHGARRIARRGRARHRVRPLSRASTSASSRRRGLVEVSLGDFVLSGGEPAAIALLDAVLRLLPGVMGKEESGAEESFEQGLLEHPHYTRPRDFEGRGIPEVLLSGDHAAIARWRHDQALELTRARRPDLMARNKRGDP
jgi:tRNA (guanine37-N1)-methyltransferase